MVSTKFKPGQHVHYISGMDGKQVHGIVMDFNQAKERDLLRVEVVWAYWGRDQHVGFMPADEVYATLKIDRNLPEWF